VIAATQAAALLVLFVVLPFVVAGLVIAFISWRSSSDPPPVRTSDILATGEPAEAEILAVKPLGGFLDTRPMVRFDLRIDVQPSPVELQVTQSVPRALLRGIGVGDRVEVRVTPDRAAAAVVFRALPPTE
jgi:hypothetical protein